MPELTKDADLLICCIYKEYLSQRKSGVSKSDACLFESDFYTTSNKISSWSEDDVFDTLSELEKNSFVKTFIDGSFQITEKLVIYMENRFKNGLSEVMDFISNLPLPF